MSDHITISGVIGTVPHLTFGKSGIPITSFRLASRQRHHDKAKDEWIVDESCWYSVTTFRQLATNAGKSLSKGEHVVVTGRLVIRAWTNAEKSGTSVEIIADSVGHDLTWYTTTPVRAAAPSRTSADRAEPDPVESFESEESASAFEAERGQNNPAGDGFVPIDTDADVDAYARLDS